MNQVIIFTNFNGGVSVCTPTGEISIEEVLTKDCPSGAIIVDSSTLPILDNDFFNSWELNGSTISVNITKAIAQQQFNLNYLAKNEANHRSTNAGAGIENKLSDTDWLSLLSTARTTIASCTTTQQLRDAIAPVQSAISDNA